MAGHSKWANIKHRKGAQDAKRGKIFTKLIRELTTAARMSGDPSSNPRLRTAIDKALACNMTRDTVDRAIKRGAGGEDGTLMEEFVYEGYGPGGVAVIVVCLSDNKNRTAGEVRHAFTKHGGNLGADGSVSYLFTKCGQIIYEPGVSEDKVMEEALNLGAEDVLSEDDGSMEVRTTFEDFLRINEGLRAAGLVPASAEVTFIPSLMVELDKEKAESLLKMVDRLEDLDDVQNVYFNADIPFELLES